MRDLRSLFTLLDEEYLRGGRLSRAAHFKLKEMLTGSRNERPIGYLNDPELFSAYSQYYFGLHLPETHWVLDQLLAREIEFPEVKKILDVGCGPGTSSIAALLWLKKNKRAKRIKEIELWDLSKRALTVATHLIRFLTADPKTLKGPKVISQRVDLRKEIPAATKSTYDLIVCSHLFNEWGNGPRFRDRKIRFLKQLLQRLHPKHGRLILIDPPLREPTMDLMWLRDQIAAESEETKIEVLAPCPPDTEHCPLSASSKGWCYAQPPSTTFKDTGLIPRDKQLAHLSKNTSIRHRSFSYMVFGRRETGLAPAYKISVSDNHKKEGLWCTGDRISPGPKAKFRGELLIDKE